jgi:hypothetical protein
MPSIVKGQGFMERIRLPDATGGLELLIVAVVETYTRRDAAQPEKLRRKNIGGGVCGVSLNAPSFQARTGPPSALRSGNIWTRWLGLG